MKYQFLVILVIAEVCFAANLIAQPKTLEFKLPKDHPLVRRFKAVADPNGYVDTILADLDENLENHGYDHLPLPPGEIGIDDEIAGIPIHVHASVDNGSVNHLESIHRIGDVTVSQSEDGQTVLATDVIINNLTAEYHVHVDLEGIVLVDEVILVDAERVILHLELSANETTGETRVVSFYAVEVGEVVIDLEENGSITEVIVPRELFQILIRVGVDYLISNPIIGLLEDILEQNPIPNA